MEPPTKKLRFSDPDLTIILRYESTTAKGKVSKREKEYQVYSAVFAKMSTFIDAILDRDGNNVIVLHALSPQVFESAIRFLESPIATRSFDEKDAMELVDFYDRYSFSDGIELCDQALLEYFEKHESDSELTPPDDLDFLVEALVVADKFRLKKALDVGLEYIDNKIEWGSAPYDASMFSLEHVKALHPMMTKGCFSLSIYEEMTKEEIESPLFPEYFVTKSRELATPDCTSFLGLVSLSGTKTSADGVFELDYASDGMYRSKREDGEAFAIYKDFDLGNDWIIARVVDKDISSILSPGYQYKTLWKCPYSCNLHFPPMEPWLPTQLGTKHFGTPKIRYYDAEQLSVSAARS